MKLFIDAQVLQTGDASRGMGLYLSSILRSFGAETHTFSVIFLTNPQLPNEHVVNDNLKKMVPGSTTKPLALKVRTDSEETYSKFSAYNQRVVNEVVGAELKNNEDSLYFVPAFFANDIFPVFPTRSNVKKVLLFHDLIPYLYSESYFPSFALASCVDYCERFAGLFDADMILTNSQTTADDLEIYFGVSPDRMRPILGSGASREHLVAKKPDFAKSLGSFVLMPSGDDIRKNNFRGVEAFERAADELGSDIKLVITSRFSEGSQNRLQEMSKRVVFAGSVSDEEYQWLITHAEFVFFPTEYEGLGMPLIEAAKEGVRVVCSAISVFEEISSSAFVFTDPLSISSMAETLRTQIQSLNTWKVDAADYKDVEKRFNWKKTAKLFVDALDDLAKWPFITDKKHIAIFAPAVDSYSAIGKYALEAHAELARIYDIDYYFEQGQTVFKPTRLNVLKYAAKSYAAADFNAPKDYDNILYHIGNSEFHINTIYNALRYPGTIIVHDCHLKGIFDYMERLGYMTKSRYDAETILSDAYASKESSYLVSIAHRAHSIICHSKYVESALRDITLVDAKKIHRIDHPIATPTIQLQPKDGTKLVVSFAGIISADKGLALIKDIAESSDDIEVRLFGFGVLGDDTSLLAHNVTILKDLSDLSFQNNLRDTDILVNYRTNYHGETSRSALEAMRYGVRVIVNNVGWFSELPDQTVIKVKDVTEIMDAIRSFSKGKPARLEQAANHTRSKLGSAEYAQKIKGALK